MEICATWNTHSLCQLLGPEVCSSLLEDIYSNSQVGPDPLNWSTQYLVGIQGNVMAALILSPWPLTHFLGLVTVAVGGVG